MNAEHKQEYKYTVFKALKGNKPFFVDMTDEAAVEGVRNSYGNRDLLVSTWYSAVPDISAPRNYSICFRIVSNNIETARVNALEAIYYIEENYCISAKNMEIIYADGGENGGGAIGRKVVGDDINTGQNDGKTGPENVDHVGKKAGAGPDSPENCKILTDIGKRADQQADSNVRPAGRADDKGQDGGGVDENTNIRPNDAEIGCVAGRDGCRSKRHNPTANDENKGHKGPNDAASAAEIILLVHPMVFDGRPTPLMPAMNRHLASQMVNEGLTNIEIDSFIRDSYIPLPNAINIATGRFVIPLTLKELLYLDGHHIAELSKQPRPDDSMIMPQEVPEAIEWFAGVLTDFEKEQRRQNELRKLILENGWQITPCIRRLIWMDLSEEQALEACRIISQFYSWTKASSDEIWYHLQQIDRRNHIQDYPRLKAIITFALDFPGFAGCQHLLLKQFCPAGKCFIKELIDEYEKPYLFNDI